MKMAQTALSRSPLPVNSELEALLQDQTLSEFSGRGERVNYSPQGSPLAPTFEQGIANE